MKKEEIYKLKDRILAKILEDEEGNSSTSTLALMLYMDDHPEVIDPKSLKEVKDDQVVIDKVEKEFYPSVHTMVEALIGEGFFWQTKIAGKNFRDDALLTISHRGRFFYLNEGGFKSLMEKEQKDMVFNWIKVGAVILNALAIIGVSIWAVSVNKETNRINDKQTIEMKLMLEESERIEQISNELKIEVQELKNEVEKLQTNSDIID